MAAKIGFEAETANANLGVKHTSIWVLLLRVEKHILLQKYLMHNLTKTIADIPPPIDSKIGFAVLTIAAIVGLLLLIKRFLKNKKP